MRVSVVDPLAESAEKAHAHPLSEAVEAFLLTKRVAGCTEATLPCYTWWLGRLLADVPILTPLAVRGFFARLQDRRLSPNRQHQAYRTIKTFLRWCLETGELPDNPLRGLTMRTPKTLPDVPTEDELRAVLAAGIPSEKGTAKLQPNGRKSLSDGGRRRKAQTG